MGAGNRQLSDPRFSYTYDDEGNRTAKVDAITGERTEYVWDARNRLDEVKVETSSGAVVKDVDYIYDALNQKIGKIVKNGSGVIVNEEHYGVETRTASRSVPVAGMLSQATLDQVSIVTGANGAVTERYVYGPAVDQVLAVDSVGSQVLWMLGDQQGSVRTVISSAGTKLKSIEYDGFGHVVSDTAPTVAVRFLYTGREWDADTQLQNNRARWFDPATGRWLSNDPMGFAAGDVNLQRYVGNGAPNATDPSGLFLYVPVSERAFWENLLGSKATYTLRSGDRIEIDVLPGIENRDVATHDAIANALRIKGVPEAKIRLILSALYGGNLALAPANRGDVNEFIALPQLERFGTGNTSTQVLSPKAVADLIRQGLAVAEKDIWYTIRHTDAGTVYSGRNGTKQTSKYVSAKDEYIGDGLIYVSRKDKDGNVFYVILKQGAGTKRVTGNNHYTVLYEHYEVVEVVLTGLNDKTNPEAVTRVLTDPEFARKQIASYRAKQAVAVERDGNSYDDLRALGFSQARAGLVAALFNAALVPIGINNHVQERVPEVFEQQRATGANKACSGILTVLYSLASIVGLVDVEEAVVGKDIRTQEKISDAGRIFRGVIGVAGVAFSGVLFAKTLAATRDMARTFATWLNDPVAGTRPGATGFWSDLKILHPDQAGVLGQVDNTCGIGVLQSVLLRRGVQPGSSLEKEMIADLLRDGGQIQGLALPKLHDALRKAGVNPNRPILMNADQLKNALKHGESAIVMINRDGKNHYIFVEQFSETVFTGGYRVSLVQIVDTSEAARLYVTMLEFAKRLGIVSNGKGPVIIIPGK